MQPKFADMTREGGPDPVPHLWKPIYERRQLRNRESVVATVPQGGVDLILKLTEICAGPFGILYVLVVPRRTHPGRYQLKEWLDRDSFLAYLERYRSYFEGDGRHDIWVKCGNESLIVFDRHEVFHLYGDIEGFCNVLENLGYGEGEVRIDFPHEHHYNAEFDDDELSIVNSTDYVRSNLVAGQDFEAGDPRFEAI